MSNKNSQKIAMESTEKPAETPKPPRKQRRSRLNRKTVVTMILFAIVLYRCYKVTFPSSVP
jgi:hypothetical protein